MTDFPFLSQSGYPRDYPYVPQAAKCLPVPESKTASFVFSAAYIPALCLLAVFALGNFAIAPLMYWFRPGDWAAAWVFAAAGAILAQAAILCCAFVFVDAAFWQRSIGFCAAVILLWAWWAAGFVASLLFRFKLRAFENSEFAEGMQFVILALPLAAIAIQAPLWFFRIYLNWRLTPTAWQSPRARSLTIRDYFLGTAIVAVAITCARLAPRWNDPNYWANWSIFIVSAGGASLIGIVPAMLLVFRCRDWRLALAATVVYGFLASLLTLGVCAVVDPSFRSTITTGSSGLWNAAQVIIIFLAFALLLSLGLVVIKALGFRLTRTIEPWR